MDKQGLVVFSLPLRLSIKGFGELIKPRQHTSLPSFFYYFVYLYVCTCVSWCKSVQRPEVPHVLLYHSLSYVFQASVSWFGQVHCLTYMDVGVCNQVLMVMQQAFLNRAISPLFDLYFFFLTFNFQQNYSLPFVAYYQPPKLDQSSIWASSLCVNRFPAVPASPGLTH